MSVPFAFLGVILIWSTTPLAIQWSSEGWGFLFGVAGRMVLGSALCFALLLALRQALPWNKAALQTYAAAGLGIYGSMLCVYWGAQYVPSGLIAVLFGLTPMATGLAAALLLRAERISVGKVIGMGVGFAGLAVVFNADLHAGLQSFYGVAAILVSVVLHALSSVLVKRIAAPLSALAVTSGGMFLVTPLYVATWWLLDGAVPSMYSGRSMAALVYLGAIGSVVGFVLYFYVLKRLDASRAALITLVTPVFALALGSVFNGERLDATAGVGAAIILAGLALYQWADARLAWVRARW